MPERNSNVTEFLEYSSLKFHRHVEFWGLAEPLPLPASRTSSSLALTLSLAWRFTRISKNKSLVQCFVTRGLQQRYAWSCVIFRTRSSSKVRTEESTGYDFRITPCPCFISCPHTQHSSACLYLKKKKILGFKWPSGWVGPQKDSLGIKHHFPLDLFLYSYFYFLFILVSFSNL